MKSYQRAAGGVIAVVERRANGLGRADESHVASSNRREPNP